LHFATTRPERFDREGVIWMVHYVRAHELAPPEFRAELETEGANIFTTEMLTALAKNVQSGSFGPFVQFVEPPSFDERIVNQYALFSLMSHPDASLGFPGLDGLTRWVARYYAPPPSRRTA
jgi:hypothetical protein